MSDPPPPPALSIFIAYRRDDTEQFAGRIHDRLADHFEPPGSVFRDVNDLMPGWRYEEAIDEAIDLCDVFVLLIGQGWLQAGPGWWRRLTRNRRIDHPDDRHRREIEAAVGRNVRTFVVLMEDAKMPEKQRLPTESEGLQKVPDIHALRIADHAFYPGVEQLIKGIETAAKQAREAKRARGLEPKEKREAEKREREEVAKQKRDEEGKRRLLTFAALVLGAVVLIVGAVLIIPDGPEVAEVEVAEVEVGGRPVVVALEEEKAWVTDREANNISSIDVTPESEEFDQSYSVGDRPDGVAVDREGTVWVANGDAGTVSMLDRDNDYTAKKIDVGMDPGGIAADLANGSIWVANGGDDTVSWLDPTQGYENHDEVKVGLYPYGVMVGDDHMVWVTNRDENSVSRINPDLNKVGDPIEVGANPKGIDATVDAVWVANTADDNVSKIDLPSLNVENFDVGEEPLGVSAASDSVWVSLKGQNQVARLDPESGDVEQEIDVGEGPEGIVAAPHSVWVANGDDGTVTRISR